MCLALPSPGHIRYQIIMDEAATFPSTSPDEKVVHFVPLGGLGQVGMNCFALQQDGAILIVDCGATFPEDDIGEDLIVPDFSWVVERRAQLTGIFITHGHEDHIGALPHLVSLLDAGVFIYAPAHAAALIAGRFKDQGISCEGLRIVEPGQHYQIGPFTVEPIRVAHSIVQATALCISTSVGRIIHTADFNLDAVQPAGWLTDEARFRALGQDGVRLLLSDSTNVETDRREQHEGDVENELIAQVCSAEKRVIVGLFSSNAHRLSALIAAAQRSGRRICLLGRSLRRHFFVAADLGHIKYPSNLLVAAEELRDLEPEHLLVVAGGSQGEPTSALKKLSDGAHPHLKLEEGDRVILSCRVIPGNERRVHNMVNNLLRQKVDMITTRSHRAIHVSGHASRSELRSMLEWTTPQAFIPVHGTLTHMQRHQTLARECGVSDTLVVENGAKVAIFEQSSLMLQGRVPYGVTRLALGGGVLDGPTRRQRFSLARSGLISIAVHLDQQELLSERPKISSLGVVGVDHDHGAMSVISSTVVRTVHEGVGRRMRKLEDVVAQAVRSIVLQISGERPVVVVHVLRASSMDRDLMMNDREKTES